eukprot:scaffold462_cov195-Pinguiococcus_pyrenoidosus.AAC.16
MLWRGTKGTDRGGGPNDFVLGRTGVSRGSEGTLQDAAFGGSLFDSARFDDKRRDGTDWDPDAQASETRGERDKDRCLVC